MSFASNLNQQCTVYRAVRTQDAIGGIVNTWSAIISNAPCLLQAVSANNRIMSGSTGVSITHRIYMQIQTTPIDETDEIQVGSVRYRVLFVNSVRSHHLEIDLIELRRGA